jgi:hypothetical protein
MPHDRRPSEGRCLVRTGGGRSRDAYGWRISGTEGALMSLTTWVYWGSSQNPLQIVRYGLRHDPTLGFCGRARRTSEPGLAGRLGGRNAALEQVTERLRGTIPVLAARPSFAAMPHLLWRVRWVTFVRIVFLMQARILLLAGILVVSGCGKPQVPLQESAVATPIPKPRLAREGTVYLLRRGCYY